MKTIIFVIGLLSFAFNSSAQSISVDTTEIFESNDNDEWTYPVGYRSMIKFLMENLSYPDSSKKVGIDGTVKVSFCVDTTGKVTDIKILQGINNEIDNEVIRVFKLLPAWEPIIIAGGKEKMNFRLPIKFSLTDWTASEVKEWIGKYGQYSTWKGWLLYQGSDSLNHHFISRVNDDWTWFNIKRTELPMQDIRTYNRSSSSPLGYYYVDPIKDFVKVKDY